MRTSGPGQSPLLLLDAVEVLARAQVEYAVIGAMAAAFHGVVRASLDADALIFPGGRPLDTLEKLFREAGFRAELRRGDSEDPIPALIALEDALGNRVDLLAGLRGLDSGALSRTTSADYEGTSLRVIGLEDFIAMKVFAGSPKDIEDARNAIAVSRSALDLRLLRELALRFGRRELSLLDSMLASI